MVGFGRCAPCQSLVIDGLWGHNFPGSAQGLEGGGYSSPGLEGGVGEDSNGRAVVHFSVAVTEMMSEEGIPRPEEKR